MEKIFLVTAGFSSWDTAYRRNLKAFTQRKDAEKYVEKATRIFRAMSEHIAKAYADLDDEDSATYQSSLNIWVAHHNLEEFSMCTIEEIEIN